MSEAPNQASSTTGQSAIGVTDAVCHSFALGWQMARLYSSPLRGSEEPRIEEDLPGLSRLPSGQTVGLGLDQVDVGLKVLSVFLEPSGVTLATTTKLRSFLKDSGDATTDDLRRAVLLVHVELLTKITAADFRCGKAYGLGRALSDTCSSSQTSKELAHHLEAHRASELVGWLSDLKTLLPDHAAEAVSQSFTRWVESAKSNPPAEMDEDEAAATSRLLHAQGQRWRALLSGEKAGTDVLKVEDYVTVASKALRRSGAIGGQLALHFLPVLVAAGALLAFGIVLIVVYSSGARAIAGLGTIAVSLGITWRGAASGLAQLARRLEEPIWGGEMDEVIGERLTAELPKLERPVGGGGPAEVTDADKTIVIPVQLASPRHESDQ